MKNSRRQFLTGFPSGNGRTKIAREGIASETNVPRLPIAFSTLACPAWEWKKILQFAVEHKFAAIELRGLEGNLDLPSHAIFAPERIGQTKREILSSKLRIACVSSSANLHFADSGKRAKELNDARRFIDLAATLGAPCVRVFGGKDESDTALMPDDRNQGQSGCGPPRTRQLCRPAQGDGDD